MSPCSLPIRSSLPKKEVFKETCQQEILLAGSRKKVEDANDTSRLTFSVVKFIAGLDLSHNVYTAPDPETVQVFSVHCELAS